MAKNVGLFGAWTGKLANTVGYLLKNSNNNVTQGVRAYQPIVSNPKSEPQATQRMKMTAALNFYRQLGPILNNAWQGTKYGTESRQKFMSLAMSKVTGIPFVDKGDKKFYPGEFPVAQGSIPTQSVTLISTSNGALTTLKTTLTANSLNTLTWGEVSQDLVNLNFGIKNGDKLTFIVVAENNGEYMPVYTYVILNTQSEDLASIVFANSKLIITPVDSKISFAINAFATTGLATSSMVAAAIIVSRYPSAGNTWERSNASMKCSDAYLALMMGTERFNNAAATYMNKSTSLSSDWYLNVGVDGKGTVISGGAGDSNLSIVSQENITVTLDHNNNGDISTQIAILTMSDGTKRAAKTDQNNIAYIDGGSFVNQVNFRATTTNLERVKAADSAVTGYAIVNYTSSASPDPTEERP